MSVTSKVINAINPCNYYGILIIHRCNLTTFYLQKHISQVC